MKKLIDYAYNKYSQFGEDGIIEKIFQVVGTESKLCIEFGAWDGLHYSNTARLWMDGWPAVLIEMNIEKYRELLRNIDGYKCCAINAKVGSGIEDQLEVLLDKYAGNVAKQVDFISIDVDGDDYHIFESLSSSFKPRVVCCEYNPTIPPNIELVPGKGNYFGCSALSLTKLAKRKGYSLIAMTETNCFFVLEEYAKNFKDYETRLEFLFIPKHLTYLMSGYDGDFLLSRQPTYGFRKALTSAFVGKYYSIPIEQKKSSTQLLKRILKIVYSKFRAKS